MSIAHIALFNYDENINESLEWAEQQRRKREKREKAITRLSCVFTLFLRWFFLSPKIIIILNARHSHANTTISHLLHVLACIHSSHTLIFSYSSFHTHTNTHFLCLCDYLKQHRHTFPYGAFLRFINELTDINTFIIIIICDTIQKEHYYSGSLNSFVWMNTKIKRERIKLSIVCNRNIMWWSIEDSPGTQTHTHTYTQWKRCGKNIHHHLM